MTDTNTNKPRRATTMAQKADIQRRRLGIAPGTVFDPTNEDHMGLPLMIFGPVAPDNRNDMDGQPMDPERDLAKALLGANPGPDPSQQIDFQGTDADGG